MPPHTTHLTHPRTPPATPLLVGLLRLLLLLLPAAADVIEVAVIGAGAGCQRLGGDAAGKLFAVGGGGGWGLAVSKQVGRSNGGVSHAAAAYRKERRYGGKPVHLQAAARANRMSNGWDGLQTPAGRGPETPM